MLFSLLGLLFRNPLAFFVFLGLMIVALLVAVTIHEFSHAFIAHRLGDDTARRLGRLTLNPLAHLDPLGTVMLFLVGFGWGKPVPVNPYFLRTGYRRGMAQVAAAGPASNLVIATVFALPVHFGILAWWPPFYIAGLSSPMLLLSQLIALVIVYDLLLALFNLIPIAPLDGFSIALGLLPQNMARSFARLAPYGPALLVLLIIADGFLPGGILWRIMGPAMNLVGGLLVGRPLV